MHLRAAAIATTLSLSTIVGAGASTLDAMFARLNEYLEPLDAELLADYPGKVKYYVMLNNLRLQAAAGPAIPLAEHTSVGEISVLQDEMLLVSEVGGVNFERDVDPAHVTIGSWAFGNLLLPPLSTDSPMIWAQTIGSVAIDKLHVQIGRQVVDLDKLTFANFIEPARGTAEPTSFFFTLGFTGLTINETILQFLPTDIPGRKDLQPGIKADLFASGTWDIEAGTLSMEPIRLDLPTRGNYILGANFSGVSLPLVEEIIAFAMKSAGQPTQSPSEQEEQAFGLSLLSQVAFEGGFMRIEDKGIAQNILADVAQRRDVTDAAAPDLAVEEVRFGLDLLDLPSLFIDQFADVATSFFGQGGNVMIRAQPETAVRLIELIALAQSPPVLVDRLKLEPLYQP